jgi:hypothetical protein
MYLENFIQIDKLMKIFERISNIKTSEKTKQTKSRKTQVFQESSLSKKKL